MAGLLATTKELFLTAFYFVYFLFKGKPEWKCSKRDTAERVTTCCVESTTAQGVHSANCSSTSNGSQFSSSLLRRPNEYSSHPAPSSRFNVRGYFSKFVEAIRRGIRWVTDRFKLGSYRGKDILYRLGHFIVSAVKWTWNTLIAIICAIPSLILFRRPPSKTMPPSAKPKTSGIVPSIPVSPIHDTAIVPHIPQSTLEEKSAPVLIFSPKAHQAAKEQSADVPTTHAVDIPSVVQQYSTTNHVSEHAAANEGSALGGAFYSTRVFNSPPPPPPDMPMRMTQSYHDNRDAAPRSTTPSREAVKGGIPVFPPGLMAEIAGTGGGAESLKRSEVNRTPNRTVRERLREQSATPTNRKPYEYSSHSSRIDTPRGWNAERSKRAQSVGSPRVSRIADSANNEAQFIFRARPTEDTYGSELNGYRMGYSVYNPVVEADTYRENINKEDEWGLRFRGATPTAALRGQVVSTIRNWPPPPNAEGADIGKDHYVNSTGMLATACRRIVEKKNEESWRFLDDKGRLLDERSEYTVMGDRDELTRDGPFRTQHLSQHFFVDRDGSTRWENVNRQYDRGYVVESVCRNY